MYPLFKPLWRIYVILGWGGFFLVILAQVQFIIRQTNLSTETGVTNDAFASELIAVSVIAVIIYLFCFMTGALMLVSAANKKVAKLTEETLKSCKIQEFIVIYENFQKQAEKHPKRLTRDAILMIILNHSVGYLNLGDYTMAKLILEKLPTFKAKKSEDIFKFFYFNNWCNYYLGINDLEQAQSHLEKARQILDGNAHLKTKYWDLHTSTKISFSIAKKDVEGVEVTLQALLKNAKNSLQKVSRHYGLGQLYLHENRIDEACTMFKYVIENGGDTYFVNEAQTYLNQIKSEIRNS